MLVQPSAGCRPGWPAGYYRHDTEDDDNDNDATRGLLNYLRIPYDQDFVTVNYCAKSAGNTNTPWPVGKYCLAKHGHCPGGFLEGSITWDDEDTNNNNKILKPVPSSSNLRNPTIRYCCRQDGSALQPILLPPNKPFGMYRHGGTCQKVFGMTERQFRVTFDGENSGVNEGTCSGNHPDDDECDGGDHKVWFCSYTPNIGDVPWPSGQYSLIQGTGGCPPKLSAGFIRHDTENGNNENHVDEELYEYLWMPQSRNFASVHYCTKTDPGNSTTDGLWPPGKYCIGRHGGQCPSGFNTGSILWDDEDDNNMNIKRPPIPDTSSDYHNIRVYYCCRNDGDANTAITLPSYSPFGLYRYGGTCQQVYRMTVRQFKVHFDDEYWWNDDECTGSHPDNDSCNNDHDLWVCAYRPNHA